MTREEAIILIGANIKEIQGFINCAADPEKSYPNSIKFCEALGMAISALREQEELESKLRALESSGWISVEERLPECDQRVLCRYTFGGSGRMYFHQVLDYYATDPQPHFQHTLGNNNMRVTHWMPLPEAPKEDV